MQDFKMESIRCFLLVKSDWIKLKFDDHLLEVLVKIFRRQINAEVKFWHLITLLLGADSKKILTATASMVS